MSLEERSGRVYDIAVIGGGAAGCMAAVRAAELGRRVVLIERNDAICRKVLITGKGRCNLTNVAPPEDFIERFGKQGQFLRSAFHAFFNEDLMDFFRTAGLEVKVERQGRVFPVTDSARSVTEVFRKRLGDLGAVVLYGLRLSAITQAPEGFRLTFDGSKEIVGAQRVILATGGASYQATGSSGDGYVIAHKLGHAISKHALGLVPLTTKEAWVKDLQGLGLENIRLTFVCGKKKIVSEIGELMFTHFGVSGPLVLDLSARILGMLKSGEVRLFIDLKTGMTVDQLEKRLLNEFKVKGKAQLKTILKEYLPQRLIDLFTKLSGIDPRREACQVTLGERRALIGLFKALPLAISGSLSGEEAMVTGDGIAIKEIDPRSMESRLVNGLYFAGEIIEGSAPSGGYNLQQAFSTGYLAGQKAAESLG